MNYTPPFTITPKILDLVSLISESVGKLEVLAPTAISPQLRKANKIKTITGTLAIEGNTLGIDKVTAILEGKRVMGSMREIAEVNGAIAVYDHLDNFDYRKLDDLLLGHKMLMGEILTQAGSKGESTPFIAFMLEAILKACEDELKNEDNVPINVPKNVPIKRLDKILALIADDSSITIDQLAQICKVSDKTIKRDIAKLKEQGTLEREGSLKSGHWKLVGDGTALDN